MTAETKYRLPKAAAVRAGAALWCVCACGSALSQTSNTVVARFGILPKDRGSTFSVVLENRGPVTTISGFAFKVAYRNDQARLSTVVDNTSQPQAVVQYGLGDPVRADLPNNTDTYRVLTMTTVRNLAGVGHLAELVFEKQTGYSGAFCFHIEDRVSRPVDGLLGGDITNIDHGFDIDTLQKAGR